VGRYTLKVGRGESYGGAIVDSLMAGKPTKFLLDGMCGKLARWLRILGFDASYLKDAEDEDLLKAAKEEARVLVTRDVELYRKALKLGLSVILISGASVVDGLSEFLKVVEAEPIVNIERSRCPNCNGALTKTGREDVAGRVPPRTYSVYREYWVCGGCGKVYWLGSHWRNITKILNDVKAKLKGN